MISVFVVNMAKHVDRKFAIKTHLESLQIDFQLIEAVDGKMLSNEDLRIMVAPEASIPLGHVGCYLSHINVYRRMVEEKIPVALILEDDARIHPRVTEIIRLMDDSQLNFDYCFLDSENFNSAGSIFYDKNDRIKISPELEANRLSHGPSATHAYLITLSAACRRLKHAFPITFPIDVYDHLPYEIRFYSIVTPKLAWLSEYGLTSATYDRKPEDKLAFRGLKKFYFYYQLRDFLSFSWLSGWKEAHVARKNGRLPKNGRWKRLPQGKVIIVD
jgi:GR25 family glycosyltransferase involved in LPS biosynthesis